MNKDIKNLACKKVITTCIYLVFKIVERKLLAFLAQVNGVLPRVAVSTSERPIHINKKYTVLVCT